MSPGNARRESTVRILIADVDEDTRHLYRESLRSTGCDVIDAADGREALVSALTHRPSLVITETRLPIFDGFELCEVLRRDSQTSSVPILVVTGEARKSELDRARKAGADSVLIKPVTPDALLVEVQRLIGEPPSEPDTKNETPELFGRSQDRSLTPDRSRMGAVKRQQEQLRPRP